MPAHNRLVLIHNRMSPIAHSADPIAALLSHVRIHAETFHTGALCGAHSFTEGAGVGHLHVIRSGRVRLRERGSPEVHIEEPSIVFFARPLRHRLMVVGRVPGDVICANIRYGVGQENALTRSLPPVLVVPYRTVRGFSHSLALLRAEADDDALGRTAVLDRVCEILVVQLVRHAVERRLVTRGVLAGLAHPRIASVVQAVAAKPGARWSVERMAVRANLSRSAFSREFVRIVGQSPADFLAEVRVAEAQRLLATARTLDQVALAVGYSSQPALSRAFIRRTGTSPSRWLRAFMRGD